MKSRAEVPGAATAPAPLITPSLLPAAATGSVRRTRRGISDGIDGVLQELARGREILEQLHLPGEVDDEGGVAVLANHLVEKAIAGAALGRQQATLTLAHVHQQAEAQWQIGLCREIADGLGAAVFGEGEVVLG